MASHLVDLARFILGKEPMSIAASLDPVHLIRHPDAGTPRSCVVSNYFSAQCDFQGTATHLATSAAVHSPPAFDVTVYGENADLTFDLGGGLRLMRLGSDPEIVLSYDVDDEYRSRIASSVFSTSFTYFADNIVQAILDDDISALREASTVIDAVINMKVLDASLRSARQGERVVFGAWPPNNCY
jgi:predicted dehydrogenase